jgi:hypothetical protein
VHPLGLDVVAFATVSMITLTEEQGLPPAVTVEPSFEMEAPGKKGE